MPDPSLDPRLARLLHAVVDAYVKTAQPVGSQTLVEDYALGVSSATVRNWFVELDGAGYLAQPHTSGGRVPTEAGYRAYVRNASDGPPKPASKKARQAFEEAAASDDPSIRAKRLAKALADLSGLGVFVRFQAFDSYYTGLSQLFAQPEFRDWQRVVSLSEVLDRLDEALQILPPPALGGPSVLIGSEGPFGSACSSVYLGRGTLLVGVLGPLRMEYLKAQALLGTLATFL